MFVDGSFFKELVKAIAKESNWWFGRRRFLKVFLLWLPWLPEFFMELNYLKEFEGVPPKEHSCEIW